MKKLGALAITVVMLMSISACSGDTKATNQTTAETTAIETTTTTTIAETTSVANSENSVSEKEAVELTEEEKVYVDKLTSIFSDIQTISKETAQALNPEDLNAIREAMKTMIDKTKPLYEQMGELKAPAKFAESQKKISEGVEASIRVLEISAETILLTENDTEKGNALMAEAKELEPKLISFSEGLNEVIPGIDQ